MPPRRTNENRILRIVYLATLAAVAILVLLFTDVGVFHKEGADNDYSADWTADGGAVVRADEITAGGFGGSVTLEKRLPSAPDAVSDLCFVSDNANIVVWLDGQEVYRFTTIENFSGMGYGAACHAVRLSREDAGKTVRIRLESVFSDKSGGRVKLIRLCDYATYQRAFFGMRFWPCMMSVLLLFFGLLLIVIYFCMPAKSALPYDLPALGMASSLFGLWCLIDTGLPRMITGGITAYRTLEYLLLILAEYPLLRFVNSVTRRKRPLYERLAFAVSFTILGLVVCLRALGNDLHLLMPLIYCSYFAEMALIVVILADNALYCRRRSLPMELKGYSFGAAVFLVCVTLDCAFYLSKDPRFAMHGTFLRFGLCMFVLTMLLQFLRWWSTEHASIEHDRFINHILQYAVSSGDPEASIRAALAYLGAELRAERAYIFEGKRGGVFDNTYEWCGAGVAPQRDKRKNVPYQGVCDAWYEEFDLSQRVLIYDLEAYRQINPRIYDALKPQGIRTMIVAPLELGGDYVGFFGVDNPSPETMRDIAEMVRLLSFFFSQMLLQRDEQERLVRYSYFDALTGCRNRRALGEFEKERLDVSRPYGYLLCDINGLKAANDTLGHEAGDAMITDVSSVLCAVFGPENVYRMGGDEFAVYTCSGGADDFAANVARVKAGIAEKGRSAAIGAVFRPEGDPDFRRVRAEADRLMYEDKSNYYRGRNDRRR